MAIWNTPWIKKYLLLGLALAIILFPVGIYYYVIIQKTANIPRWDDYHGILRFFIRFYDSSDLLRKIELFFGFHNEHRILPVRIFSFLSYYLLGEINFKWLAIIGNLGLVGIVYLFYKSLKINKQQLWYFIPVPFILFQFQYWELSLWALASIQSIYSILFATACFYVLSKEGEKSFIMAVVLALLSAFSSGNGLFTFIAAYPILLSKPDWKLPIIKWSAVTVFAVVLYFGTGSHELNQEIHGAVSVGFIEGRLIPALHQPLLVLQYFLSLISNSFARDLGPLQAQLVGAFLVLFAANLFFFKRNYQRNSLLLALILFVLGSALMVALIRGPELGIEQSLRSRYKIHSLLLLAGLYLAYVNFWPEKIKNYYAFILIVLSLWFYQMNFDRFYLRLYDHHDYLVKGLIRHHLNYSTYTLNHWGPELAEIWAKTCSQRGYYTLPNFNKIFYSSSLVDLPLPKKTNNIQSALTLTGNSELYYIYDGWAFVTGNNSWDSKTYVVFDSEDKDFVFTTTAPPRPEVTRQYKDDNLKHSGFSFSIPWGTISPGVYRMGLLIMNDENYALDYKKIVKIGEDGRLSWLDKKDLKELGLKRTYHSINRFHLGQKNLTIRGWAFKTGRDTSGSRINIKLKSEDQAYTFGTDLEKRDEVTRAYKRHNTNYDYSGFIANIPLAEIDPGLYKTRLIIENKNYREVIQLKNYPVNIKKLINRK